jgi:hypothetical protein
MNEMKEKGSRHETTISMYSKIYENNYNIKSNVLPFLYCIIRLFI